MPIRLIILLRAPPRRVAHAQQPPLISEALDADAPVVVRAVQCREQLVEIIAVGHEVRFICLLRVALDRGQEALFCCILVVALRHEV